MNNSHDNINTNNSWEKHMNGKPVWKYFLKSIHKKDGKSNRFACKCNYCNIIMDGKPQMMFKHLISVCASIPIEDRAEVLLLHKTQMLDQVQQAITTDLSTKTTTTTTTGGDGRTTTTTNPSTKKRTSSTSLLHSSSDGGNNNKLRNRELQQAAQELGKIIESSILKLRQSATQSSITSEYSKRCKELEDRIYSLKQEQRNLRIDMARNNNKNNDNNNNNNLKTQLEIIIDELQVEIYTIENEYNIAQGNYNTSLQSLKRLRTE